MCGIAGLIDRRGDGVSADTLLRMQGSLTHRGPDDAGIYVNENVGLVHTRLSIIDLGTGHQPMCNEDGTIWIVFNGEIYNYKELQVDLAAKGHAFRTSCDTEVIVHLYEEYGLDCASHLNGMFAFAIWDQNARRLLLARDRMGVKPLYYAITDRHFVFGSEVKALFQSRAIEPECNEHRIPEYLVFRAVAGTETLFKNVRHVPPGHVLVLESGEPKLSAYWSLGRHPLDEASDEGEYIDRVSALLEDSVRLRLRSDVPLGTFCSGGIDSSLVTAVAAKMQGAPLNTFSVGFEEEAYDERKYARLVSQRYGTKHHEVVVGNQSFSEALPDAIRLNDEPLTHPNSVPLLLLSRHAKKFVTVILTGEGADELFGGYPRYLIPLLALKYQALPAVARTLVACGLQLSGNRRAHKLRHALSLNARELGVYNSSFVDRSVCEALWVKGAVDDSFSTRLGWALSAGDFFPGFFRWEMQSYLSAILMRQDKMTMGAAIESRVPFLDYRLVEYSDTIPHHWKFKRLQSKYLIKRLAAQHLPQEVVYRQKSGFGVPLAAWLRDSSGLGRYLAVLQDTTFKQRGYFDQQLVNGMISAHRQGSADHAEILWTMINLELWFRMFIDGARRDTVDAAAALAEW
jgi:asparagine synthase (glutamine-hydrolysing)